MQLELEIGKARKQVNQNLEIITSNFAFYCELLIYIPSSVMFKYIPKYLLAGSVYGHCIRCRLYRINIRNNKSRFVILFLVLIFFKMRFSSVNFYISLICSSLLLSLSFTWWPFLFLLPFTSMHASPFFFLYLFFSLDVWQINIATALEYPVYQALFYSFSLALQVLVAS